MLHPAGSNKDWSDDLKAQTRDTIQDRDAFAARDGQICLKHIDGGFGVIAGDDLRNGVLKIANRRTRDETYFASADELIAAGWALD